MLSDLIWLILGLVLLAAGGEALVRGAGSVARRMGISILIVALTVVAFGTSAPELAVNVLAAVRDQGGISFGNIIGSNIANIGLILGLTALVRPLGVHRSVVVREVPFMLGATALTLVMANAHRLGLTGEHGQTATAEAIGRVDGLMLLALFVVFLIYIFRIAMRQRQGDDPYLSELAEEQAEEEPLGLLPGVALLVGGLVAVVAGGDFTVDGAVGLAERLGVGEAVIGLTIVALGTSLPELATALAALRRRHDDIAVGHVVGSNIFNLLLVLGAAALARPIAVPPGGQWDLLVMAGLSLAMVPVTMGKLPRINRAEGALLLAAYALYIVWRGGGALGQ